MSTLLEPRHVGLALGLALTLACSPARVEAKMVGSLPAGARELTPRQAREAQIHRLLAQEKVARALAQAGLTTEQVRSRLADLDDQRIEKLAKNLETIQSGRGGVFILVAVGVVALVVAGVLAYFREI